ncbi:hypothetical protein [Streptomyces sp. NPDC002825]|uniref:hypothetical protein n=1 Tax=Streptomyces sp. NPDC002825 TaxID=3154666 RepID=UPI003316AD5D
MDRPRPGRVRPSPAGRPAREAEALGVGASEGSALGPGVADGAPVPVGAGAGAGEAGARVPPPVEAEAVGEGPSGGASDEGAAEGWVAAGVGAVVPTEVPGACTPYPTGAAYRAQAQVNTQVSAGRRARARALRSTGVTG